MDGALPKPGDFSICWTCGGVAAYNEDLQLVGLTIEQMEQLEENLDYVQARQAWAAANSPDHLLRLWRQMRSSN